MSLSNKERFILMVTTKGIEGVPISTMREYWSLPLAEIDDVMMRLKSKGCVKLINNKWTLTPQGAALLSGNRVRVVTRRKAI